MAEEDFRIELDAYSGPMDLLLYLIQKEEVDVHDIPVARILERYLEMLRATPVLDLDRAGEFLVMASTLLAIKSAMLLPNEDPELGELIDPREELVRQIIEFRRVKLAGQALKALQEEAALRWPRGSSPLPELPEDAGAEPPGVREATLYDIFATFHRLLRETEAGEPRRIRYDEVPMETHVDRILAAIGGGGGRAGLLALLGERRDRPFVLGTFLAILELMKEGRILAVQGDAGTEITVVLQDSDAGRAAMEAVRERARRTEAETPEGKPHRRPPWKRDGAPGPGGAGGPPEVPPVPPEGGAQSPPPSGPA
jgi:segregation and condensation protein A